MIDTARVNIVKDVNTTLRIFNLSSHMRNYIVEIYMCNETISKKTKRDYVGEHAWAIA
jgi:hypothetical protein